MSDNLKRRTNPDGGPDGQGTMNPDDKPIEPIDNVPVKVGFLKKIWVKVDGKKTAIGTVGGLIGIGLAKLPHAVVQAIGYFLQAICWPLTAVGVIHKGKKVKGKKEDLITAIRDWLDASYRVIKIIMAMKNRKE